MATMAAKLKGKVEVVRRLTKEKKAIKEAANQHEISLFLILYNEINILVNCSYSKAEILKLVELCIKEAKRKRG